MCVRIGRHYTNPFTILILQLTPCFVLLFVHTRVFLIKGWAVIPTKIFQMPNLCSTQVSQQAWQSASVVEWEDEYHFSNQHWHTVLWKMQGVMCTSLKSGSYFHFKPLLLEIVFQSKDQFWSAYNRVTIQNVSASPQYESTYYGSHCKWADFSQLLHF